MNAYIIDREKVFQSIELLANYKDKNKAITEGLRKASRVLITSARSSLTKSNKKKTGNLYKSISYIIKRMKAGAIAGFKRGGNYKGNHAHLIDKGTTKRTTNKGYNRGSYSGSKFWTNTINTKENQVHNTLYEAIEESIVRIIKRQQ